MIKEPITNILGLKALAWDYNKGIFISPARPDFVWSPGGLQASVCGRGYNHKAPDPECSCGLYAAYTLDIIDDYTGKSPISPIFLVEASGRTIIHDFGWRSAEMSIHLVAIPPGGEGTLKLAAYQAADYFGINVVPLDTMILVMDFFNTAQIEYYEPQSDVLSGKTRQQILNMSRSFISKLEKV